MALPAPVPFDLESSLATLHEASFGWARSCCGGDADEGADVLQTAYAKLIAGQAVFAGRSSFRTWLFGVIRLTALETRRKRTRDLSAPEWTEAHSVEPMAVVQLEEAEQTATLQAALVQLPDRQREVVHLVFYQGLSVAEAADVMELSVGSARVHYDRAKKRLRALLEPHFREDR
jgi:RNA polymerase sigma factor (sigma-70 family)